MADDQVLIAIAAERVMQPGIQAAILTSKVGAEDVVKALSGPEQRSTPYVATFDDFMSGPEQRRHDAIMVVLSCVAQALDQSLARPPRTPEGRDRVRVIERRGAAERRRVAVVHDVVARRSRLHEAELRHARIRRTREVEHATGEERDATRTRRRRHPAPRGSRRIGRSLGGEARRPPMSHPRLARVFRSRRARSPRPRGPCVAPTREGRRNSESPALALAQAGAPGAGR